MFRLIHWVLSWSLAIGVGSAFGHLVYDMAKAAAHAHQHDQLSYAKFTKVLLEAKPRTAPKSAAGRNQSKKQN